MKRYDYSVFWGEAELFEAEDGSVVTYADAKALEDENATLRARLAGIEAEPPLPDGWHVDDGCLFGGGLVAQIDDSAHAPGVSKEGVAVEIDQDTPLSWKDPRVLPWPVIRWLAWKAGVKV